jgi:transcriptional regulator with XRE-family HTH domain
MANLNRIKVVLVEQQKTGKWLAEQMGKSTCTVSKWCSNTNQPDLTTLDRIATLLNVDIRELITPSNNILM